MYLKTFLFFTFTFFILSNSSKVEASDTADRLQLSVKRMSNWIGVDENAMRWRSALMLNVLETESAKGDRANLEMLNNILSRFEQDTPGLNHPAFVDVRESLREHIHHLRSCETIDIADYLQNRATNEFHPVSAKELEPYRQEAIYFLELLKIEYGRQNSSSENEQLFKNLKIDSTIVLLQDLDIAAIIPAPEESFVPTQREPAEDTGKESLEDKKNQEIDEVLKQELLQQQVEQEKARNTARMEKLRALFETNRAFESEQTKERLDVHYASARSALDRFVRLLTYCTDKNLKDLINKKIAIIAEQYPKIQASNDRGAVAEVGDALGYLESTLQHPQLVTAIRRQYSLPNSIVIVQGSFVSAQISRNDSQNRPVSETILGRYIQGNAYTQTNASLELIPDPYQVSASIHLRGQVNSDTYTRQGRITAYAGSTGQFDGRRNLYGNFGGFYATDPYVSANLQSFFKYVDLNLRIAQRIAQKQFSRDKIRTEGIAAARTEIKIRDEFQQQTDVALEKGVDQIGENIGRLNQYRGMFPSVYALSHSDRIEALSHKVDSFHLAAPTYPSAARVDADVYVRVHESMLVNYVDSLLVGRTRSNKELADQAEKFLGKRPEAFGDENQKEEWSITFARVQPFRVEFEDNRIRFGIVGERFTQDANSIRTPLIIRVTFQVVRHNNKLYLVRDGDTNVEFFEPGQKSAKDISFKTFLERQLNADKTQEPNEDNGKKLDKLAAPPAEDDGIDGVELPNNLLPIDQLEGLKNSEIAKQFQLVELRTEGGWLYVGWKQVNSPTLSQLTVDTPAIQDYLEVKKLKDSKDPSPNQEPPIGTGVQPGSNDAKPSLDSPSN